MIAAPALARGGIPNSWCNAAPAPLRQAQPYLSRPAMLLTCAPHLPPVPAPPLISSCAEATLCPPRPYSGATNHIPGREVTSEAAGLSGRRRSVWVSTGSIRCHCSSTPCGRGLCGARPAPCLRSQSAPECRRESAGMCRGIWACAECNARLKAQPVLPPTQLSPAAPRFRANHWRGSVGTDTGRTGNSAPDSCSQQSQKRITGCSCWKEGI